MLSSVGCSQFPRIPASTESGKQSDALRHGGSAKDGLPVESDHSTCEHRSTRYVCCSRQLGSQQNVDGLHHRAYSDDLSLYLSPPSVKPTEAPDAPLPPLDPAILELHGTLRHAHCLSCHTPVGRDSFQDRLSELNPAWHEFQKEVESGKREEKLNPDGDIELGPGVRYEDFQVPACDQCGGPMKPCVHSTISHHPSG